MGGFSNDVGANLNFGYRGRMLTADTVSYNGFTFPPGLHSKVTIVPEYADNGMTLKYLTIAISIEFILTEPTVMPWAVGLSEGTLGNRITTTTSFSMVERLSQPGQILIFTAQGFGDFVVNGGTITDVDWGPKPQVVEWEPIAGANAVRVQWLCTTRISHCMNASQLPFVQFSYDTSWTWDESGFMGRNIDGFFELKGIHRPGALAHPEPSISLPIESYELVKAYLIKKFPLHVGFRRKWQWRLRKDKKTIDFKIDDMEIKSDSPFPPGVSNIELTQNVTSGISEDEGGFALWKLTYTGQMECVNPKITGVTKTDAKKLAWFWLGQIMITKRLRFEAVVRDIHFTSFDEIILPEDTDFSVASGKLKADASEKTNSAAGDAQLFEDLSDETVTNRPDFMLIPTFVSITDNIYSNTIQFTFSYNAIVHPTALALCIGLFEPVDAPGLGRDNWVRYITDTQVFSDTTKPFAATEVIVDLCTPLVDTSQPTDVQTGSVLASSFTIGRISTSENGKLIRKYENKFTYMSDNHTITASKLVTEAPTNDEINLDPVANPSDPTAANSPGGMVGAKGNKLASDEVKNKPFNAIPEALQGPVSENTPSKETVTTNASISTKYVIMEGEAVRYGTTINAPILISVGGVKAHSTGVFGLDVVEVRSDKVGLTANNRPCNMYTTRWKKHYVLESTPSSGRVKTTGIPSRFGK